MPGKDSKKHSREDVSKRSPEEIKELLKQNGINNLDDLIKKSLEAIKPSRSEVDGTFVYTQFIYTD